MQALVFAMVAQGEALMLAEKWRPGDDPAGYLVSEKLDGVRAYWDGHRLLSRQGHPIQVPEWFVADFPDQALDGELWLGRGRFSEIAGLISAHDMHDKRWRMVKYAVFELPGAPGSFSARYKAIVKLVKFHEIEWLQAIEQIKVKDSTALDQLLKHIVAGGGEGLMLHRADALYLSGRSRILLKYKLFDDAEARVIAWIPGQGALLGKTGSLLVETADGRRFRIGSGLNDQQRLQPPPVGSVITYRYNGLTSNGLPRFARFLRLRNHE